jgi:hypothetical protein
MRSSDYGWQLTTTSLQTFVGGSNFDPELPFRPLTRRYSELLTYRNVGGKLCALVQWRLISDTDRTTVLHGRRQTVRDVTVQKYRRTLNGVLLLALRNFCASYIHCDSSKQRSENRHNQSANPHVQNRS